MSPCGSETRGAGSTVDMGRRTHPRSLWASQPSDLTPAGASRLDEQPAPRGNLAPPRAREGGTEHDLTLLLVGLQSEASASRLECDQERPRRHERRRLRL